MKFQIEVLLLLCCITFYCLEVKSQETSDADENTKDFCAKPVPSENPVDFKWLHEHFEDGWKVQFGNAVMRKNLTNSLKGTDDENEEDFSAMCATMKLDFVENHIEGVFTGYEGKQAGFNCTRENNTCTFTNSNNITAEPVKAHISYFDGKDKDEHNLLSVVICSENGDVGNFVLAVSPTISEEEKNTISEHLKSIGFNPDLQVPFRDPSCEK